MAYEELFFRVHVIERMLEYDISDTDVREVLECGDVIEAGPDEFGMIKVLRLGFVQRRPIHVVTIDDEASQRTEIITAYEPDLDRWEPGFRSRRRP